MRHSVAQSSNRHMHYLIYFYINLKNTETQTLWRTARYVEIIPVIPWKLRRILHAQTLIIAAFFHFYPPCFEGVGFLLSILHFPIGCLISTTKIQLQRHKMIYSDYTEHYLYRRLWRACENQVLKIPVTRCSVKAHIPHSLSFVAQERSAADMRSQSV